MHKIVLVHESHLFQVGCSIGNILGRHAKLVDTIKNLMEGILDTSKLAENAVTEVIKVGGVSSNHKVYHGTLTLPTAHSLLNTFLPPITTVTIIPLHPLASLPIFAPLLTVTSLLTLDSLLRTLGVGVEDVLVDRAVGESLATLQAPHFGTAPVPLVVPHGVFRGEILLAHLA